MNSDDQSQYGFTVIELLVSVAFLLVAGIAIALQFNNLHVSLRDDTRKTAINSMHYALEEVYFKENGHYPSEINKDILRAVDPELLTDPDGVSVGEASSDYRYEPSDCIDGECKTYSLRADLENESDYVKSNRSRDQ